VYAVFDFLPVFDWLQKENRDVRVFVHLHNRDYNPVGDEKGKRAEITATPGVYAAAGNAVRYGGMSLLAFTLIGSGGAFIYRRVGHPFFMHVGLSGLAVVGEIIALFSIL